MGVPASLSKLPLFADLTAGELGLLKDYLYTKRLAPGETLFVEGDRASGCFVVLDGTVGVFKTSPKKESRLATLGSGALIGHVALIDGMPRSATCRALDHPVILIVITTDIFNKLFNAGSTLAYKILDRLTIDLVHRLRKTTSRLSELKSEDMTRHSPAARESLASAAEELIESRVTQIGLSISELDDISVYIPEDSE